MSGAKKYSLIINGQKLETSNFHEVHNPSNGDIVGLMPVAGQTELDLAVKAAQAAFPAWSSMEDRQRQQICLKIAGILDSHKDELARLITLEQGKPLNAQGSLGEVGGATFWSDYTAHLDIPVEVVEDAGLAKVEIHRKPIGVVGSITPWNFPLMIAMWHIVPALRAGNTVVIKPSEYTPLATIRMVELLNTILPAGVLNIVTGKGELGALMSSHPGINKIVFTGSAPTGRKIMGSAAENLKRLTLELGGNDAAIILPDCNIEEITEKIFWGAFSNSGQICACIKRLYVHNEIYEKLCKSLVSYAAKIKMGDGLDETSQLGPVQNAMQFNIVRECVEDAKKRGAKILIGGDPTHQNGYFYPVTLVADIEDGAMLVDREQFGPALPIIRFTNIDKVIEAANNNPNGLGGSVWSKDIAKAKALASRLECGIAWINGHGGIQPNAPFGGVKQSGIGVEFGKEGLYQNTNIQTIIVN
ncbi:aldehyde dehydrogenase family protein [uncultured Bartonella sp.]|uniref:aldehyde dehydrogenase family protein n=1 Tax=uncultured Bartonella sp. TaxID=104108 RepID=UPI0025DB0554|nr:aldehyde dehydrogenase family protein [uncultured Bartonella sp.]